MDAQIPSIIEECLHDAPAKHYRLGQFLGKGGFARCFQATDLTTNKQVAVKVISKAGLQKSRTKQKLLLEIKIHRALDHQHIVKFDTVFEDKHNVYIVLELCECRSLNEMVKKRKFLTPAEVRFYLLQLLSALHYLHSNKIIHRDLKMGNIFLTHSMDIKLGDFGLSAKLQFLDEKKRTMAGTPNYIAPQIIDGNGGHSYEVDLWSTGVICFAMLFGRPPFESSELKMTYSRIKKCQYHFPAYKEVPASAKDLIKRTLVLDPLKRMTISQMLEHPFLKESIPDFIPHTALVMAPTFQFGKAKDSKENKTLQATKIHSQKIITEPMVPNFKSHKILHEKNKNQEATVTTSETQSNDDHAQYFNVYVCSHVDYSVKYGLGYQLTNGCQGVYFNDSTILSNNPTLKTSHYITDPSLSDTYTTYPQGSLPEDKNFHKKGLLLQKIQSHLISKTQSSSKSSSSACQSEPFVFVKQWLKTKHAIMFRLSNKIFQVDFFDHSQILLHTESKIVRFLSKKGNLEFMSLAEVGSGTDSQLGRRIKYTRQILSSLKRQNDQL